MQSRFVITAAADLVAWSPVGDHYALSVDKTLTVHSVEVNLSIQLWVLCSYQAYACYSHVT